MALFSVNQNVQWFTAKAYDGNLDTVGDIVINSDNTTTKSNASKIWFKYLSSAGKKRSEIIEKANGGYITVTPAASMEYKLNAIDIKLNSGINSGTPIVGQHYTININIPNYQALGDNQFGEISATVVAKSTAAADLYMSLANALFNNVMYDVFDVYIIKTSTYTLMTEPLTESTGLTGIQIREKEQAWLQGTMQREHVRFIVDLKPIILNGIEEYEWATVTTNTTNTTTVNNSKDIADMEWFYLGEHGDQQRMMGYPNVVMHDGNYYLVDSTGYDLIQIHHAYVGSNHAVQKSEKDIIIACPLADANTHTVTNAVLAELHNYVSAVPTTIAATPTTYTF